MPMDVNESDVEEVVPPPMPAHGDAAGAAIVPADANGGAAQAELSSKSWGVFFLTPKAFETRYYDEPLARRTDIKANLVLSRNRTSCNCRAPHQSSAPMQVK